MRKKPSCDSNTCKDEEINNLRGEVCKLQAEINEWKTVADEKKENAQKLPATNPKLASKLEILHRDRNAASTCTDTPDTGESSDGLGLSKPPRVNLLKADFLLTPLAKSLSNLDIESSTADTSQAAATQETSSDTKKRARKAADIRIAKRPRVSSGSEANRQTTSIGLKTRRAAKKDVQPSFAKDGKENPEFTNVLPWGQFAPPEMPLSPRKTNSVNIPQGPRSKIPKPGRSQLPRPNNQKMRGASTHQVRSRRR